MQAEKENLALEKLSALMPQMGASTHVAALKVSLGGGITADAARKTSRRRSQGIEGMVTFARLVAFL